MRRAFSTGAVLAVVALLLSGCTINHDFTFTIDKTYTIQDATKTSYSITQVLDAAGSNSDFNKYASDLSSVEILSADYTITRNNGAPGQTVSANIVVGDANNANQGTLATASNVNIPGSVGVTTPLSIDKNVGTNLGNWLKQSPYKANATLNATTNTAPTDFDLKLTFHIKATYSAGLFSLL